MLLQVEFIPKFSVRGIWQRWRESYPANGTKADDSITVFTGVSNRVSHVHILLLPVNISHKGSLTEMKVLLHG